MQTQKPIIQNFFGKPVRFFKADFRVEMNHRNGGAPIENMTEMGSRNGTPCAMKFTLETWAIPLPDYCRAIGYPEPKIRDMLKRNKEAFEDFYKAELVHDSLGRLQSTILMAVEICDMITARLQASRIKDPATRSAVIRFQRWVIMMFGLIRRGKLRPARWPKERDVPANYLALCSLPSGRDLKEAVLALAKQEERHPATIYRRLQKFTGENTTTRKGVPRRTRSEAGSHRQRPEYQMVLDYKREHPKAGGTEIRQACNLSASASRINAWMREGMSIH